MMAYEDGEFKFLGNEEINGDRIAICGYPGSGGSLLRTYIEKLTGVVIGNDMSMFLSLPGQINGM